ncbi:hypothetical protein BT63DRAFT_268488 [Microthyrium microscopicum]|uniref:Uncharacterized protein n=1 Tax=Microthyrium microscopicum TaxID=703497 RepID=A0A6A6UF83_9PEZI|nr:hypothetical protein BT63DRAFT_268488 [Microthyrium microscopicum]
MVYLTHIIDQYDTLAARLIFIHADRYQWHNDDPRYDGRTSLQNLRLEYVDAEGYVNLRCHWLQGCPTAVNLTMAPYIDPYKRDDVVNFDHRYASILHHLFPALSTPKMVAATCCSQFAVTSAAVRKQPRNVYINIRKWLLETEMDDYDTGRVLEYMWHILFGKEAVHCPDADVCYCKLYGKCGLTCKGGDCGLYQYPLNIPRLKTIWWKVKHFLG